jgi:hypothetical protein
MLEHNEHRAGNEVPRRWAEAEEPARPVGLSARRLRPPESAGLGATVVAGSCLAVMLVVIGAPVAGLAVAVGIAPRWLVWRHRPLPGGDGERSPGSVPPEPTRSTAMRGSRGPGRAGRTVDAPEPVGLPLRPAGEDHRGLPSSPGSTVTVPSPPSPVAARASRPHSGGLDVPTCQPGVTEPPARTAPSPVPGGANGPVPGTVTSRTGQHERLPAVTDRSAAEPGCDACPHPVVDHDAVALRFCRATLHGGIVRGCVCPPG